MKKKSHQKAKFTRRPRGQGKDAGVAIAPPSLKKSAPTPTKPLRRTRTSATAKTSPNPAQIFPIVGIGASAGGLEAFTQLLRALPTDTGMAFVLVQHLDPDHASALTNLLSRTTAMPVTEVTDRLRVEPNHVYVIPPGRLLTFSRGTLTLQAKPPSRRLPHAIDFLFESLAQDQKAKAIGVILSGTASDGSMGLEAIKAEGGITFAQDGSAKYDSMPRSAIAAGCVDFVLSPEAIALELGRIAKHPYIQGSTAVTKPSAAAALSPMNQIAGGEAGNTGYIKILLLLRERAGVDFSSYKPSTIHRRITRRMALGRSETMEAYARTLRSSEKEIDALFADLLIGVTSFFRNPDAFAALQEKAFPRIIHPNRVDPVRVWVPACSSGQEAYSIAIALVEYAERATGSAPALQIFGTDLSETMLNKARHGLYPKSLAVDLSPERLRRFFVEEAGGYRVSKMLRDACVFARHNLIGAPPFSRMDLISCRNLLIYLDGELHRKILPTFHYALKPESVLFLGASESIGSLTELFEPLDKKHKIYVRKSSAMQAVPLHFSSNDATAKQKTGTTPPRSVAGGLPGELNAQREADRVAMLLYAPPSVLIDANLKVIQFRGATSPYLEPPTGKAYFQLLKMAHKDLMLALRAAINRARKNGRPVRRKNIPLSDRGEMRQITIAVTPLKNLTERCYLVSFEEPSRHTYRGEETESLPVASDHRFKPGSASGASAQLRQQLRRNSELDRELTETRDYLQSLQEQHEVAHEEIQASSEELQSGNEELQSVNEELETSKEELESTNEELITVNEEMTHRNVELTRLNTDLNNLQTSINTAILVVGRDLSLWRFTTPAEKLFNLLPTDLGRSISGIRHNLKIAGLEEFVIGVIDSGKLGEREVQDKADHWYLLRIRPYLSLENKISGAVLALIDIDALKRGEKEIKAARDYAEATLRTARDPIVILNSDLRVKTANEAFYKTFKTTPEQTENHFLTELGTGQWQNSRLRQLLETVLPGNSPFDDFELTCDFPAIGRRTLLLNARQLESDVLGDFILLSMQDITDRQELRAVINRSEIRFRRIFEAAKDGILILDPVTRKITDANPFITQFLGYSREELLNKELWEIGLLKDEQASQAAFRELQEKKFIRYEDLPLRTKTGELREVEFVSNLYEEGGQKVIQCNVRNITERKHTEIALHLAIDDLKNAQGAAERGSRAKDDFLASLSHELRTPLTPVLMAASDLRQDQRLPVDVREQLGMMERNIEIEVRLIDDLLDLTKISHGKLQLRTESCDAHDLISRAAEIVRDDARAKEIFIECTFTNQSCQITADPARFLQVIWNLLRNAVKFTPTGGRVSIRTSEVSNARGEPWLRIEVIDSGIGIDPARLDQIFLPFDQGGLTGDHRFGGVGLGLAIARAVVAAHGGRITAQSAGVNRGSTFIFELPVLVTSGTKTNPAISTRQTRPPMESPVSTKVTPLSLLLVDDHGSTLFTLSRLLQRDGHFVITASTVASALKAATQEKFDLIISDLGLPDGTGFELMEKLRASHDLRGIALSGYGTEADIARSLEAGFVAHLVKPVSLAEIRRVLASLTPVKA